MTEARMICRNVGKTLSEASYVILDADSFTGYGTIEYDVQGDVYTANLNSPEDKRAVVASENFFSIEECLEWFKESVNREVYRHTRW